MMNESMSPSSLSGLHEALGGELLAAERCALAIEHAAVEASPLKEPALDAILELAVDRLRNAIENAFEIEKRMRRNDESFDKYYVSRKGKA